jgi:hypothetical protein
MSLFRYSSDRRPEPPRQPIFVLAISFPISAKIDILGLDRLHSERPLEVTAKKEV